MSRYGRGISQRQFLLRRMTNLSLSLFWLLASVARLKARHPTGEYPQADLAILDYLVAEAGEIQHRDRMGGPTEREEAHTRLLATL